MRLMSSLRGAECKLQGYNTPSDADTLVEALARLLETAPP